MRHIVQESGPVVARCLDPGHKHRHVVGGPVHVHNPVALHLEHQADILARPPVDLDPLPRRDESDHLITGDGVAAFCITVEIIVVAPVQDDAGGDPPRGADETIEQSVDLPLFRHHGRRVLLLVDDHRNDLVGLHLSLPYSQIEGRRVFQLLFTEEPLQIVVIDRELRPFHALFPDLLSLVDRLALFFLDPAAHA